MLIYGPEITGSQDDISTIVNASTASGEPYSIDIWTGTQAQYDNITTPLSGTLYFIKE